MIEAARAEQPDGEWMLAGIEDWARCGRVRRRVLQRRASVAARITARSSSALRAGRARRCTRIPDSQRRLRRGPRPSSTRSRSTARGRRRMAGPLGELTMEAPGFYYDHLAPLARSVDIWETEYFHVMDSAPAIVDWIASTGLRPFLAVLESDDETRGVPRRAARAGASDVLAAADGRVLFPFKRTFVIAYR